MLIYKFRKPQGWRSALTEDETGANLPEDGTPWKYEKKIEISADDGPRVGASSEEIIAGVKANGFVLWPSRK